MTRTPEEVFTHHATVLQTVRYTLQRRG